MDERAREREKGRKNAIFWGEGAVAQNKSRFAGAGEGGRGFVFLSNVCVRVCLSAIRV